MLKYYPWRRPSFQEKIMEIERLRKVYAFSHAQALGKGGARSVIDQLGFRRPAVIGGEKSPLDIKYDSLPDAFVIKPSEGSTSRGVFPIIRDEAGLKCLFEGYVTPDYISSTILRHANDISYHTESVTIEALVQDPQRQGQIPYDWKFWCFQGRVGVVCQNSWKTRKIRDVKWWDGQWEDLGKARNDAPVLSTLPAPRFPKELTEVAQSISRKIRFPFVRVDLYEDHIGPMVGEITPFPGFKAPFRRDIDRMLGKAWEEAWAELMSQDGYILPLSQNKQAGV
ncbi:ATP-grasp fold amidoligase family protein [Ectothiorhodospira lacustris]|uniref:ATP-grasp fold amidoligase family protein n=1 Tax=Ectothiorhodospira lacustris TaxID=2899127 RepID=UPI001EE84497|nr:ATP-grasp fold amidoligase family protein [Ectothiorhodospira lacustris]MCG5510346.1 hypothetical protein [Ectothiorhodospira lacustris]MCG5522092.1 hypothetical protein [Ectothiorhodospira lacustris]